MSKAGKIAATLVVLLVFIILFSIVVGVRTDAGGSTPGFIGLILFVAVVFGIRAIWKSEKKEDKKDDDSSSILQK